jgi:hypothetical protein
MVIGDVGEGTREEIDVLPLGHLGLDFGWPCLEGTTVPPPAMVPRPASCDTATLTPPIYEYAHSTTRCSVIGGPVVHDPRLPELAGRYLWTDYCDRTVYALDPAQTEPAADTIATFPGQPTSFGVDDAGRVYLTTATGQLYRLDPS